LRAELNDAEMKLFDEIPHMAIKRARIIELGRALEYDMKFHRDMRRRQGPNYMAAEYEHVTTMVYGAGEGATDESEDTDGADDTETEHSEESE